MFCDHLEGWDRKGGILFGGGGIRVEGSFMISQGRAVGADICVAVRNRAAMTSDGGNKGYYL